MTGIFHSHLNKTEDFFKSFESLFRGWYTDITGKKAPSVFSLSTFKSLCDVLVGAWVQCRPTVMAKVSSFLSDSAPLSALVNVLDDCCPAVSLEYYLTAKSNPAVTPEQV